MTTEQIEKVDKLVRNQSSVSSLIIGNTLNLLEKNNSRNPQEGAERAVVRNDLYDYMLLRMGTLHLDASKEQKEIAKSASFILYKERLWELNDAK